MCSMWVLYTNLFSVDSVHGREFCIEPGGGGGGSLPLEAVPDARGGKWGGRVSNSGVGAECTDCEKGVKIANKGEKGIQITMIKVQAVGI